MTGREFHDAIKLDRRTVSRIAQLLGLKDRAYLYHLFKMKSVPEKYVIRAMTIGMKFQEDELDRVKNELEELKIKYRELEKRMASSLKSSANPR